ncbi:MAG: hypothetical protein HOI88_04985 [Phycisphaerae bacterium]|jgi:Tfp pilus assembly protein PilX|nr:hypothetical protein [Phycisphaerae bacterium]
MTLNNFKTSKHNRRGIALMLVMVAILVTGTMAVAYFGSRDNSIAISSNVEASARARAVAESGLDLAIAILETNSDWRTQHTAGVILDSFAFGGGEITLTVYDSETDLPPTETTNKVSITILSSVNGIAQTTAATATIIPYEEEYDVDYSEYAIFAQSEINIQDVASVQQWRASPLAAQQSPLQIGTLATNPMAVQIDSLGQHSNLFLHALSNASSMVSSTISSSFELSNVAPFPTPPLPPTHSDELTFVNDDKDDDHKNRRNDKNRGTSTNNWYRSFVKDNDNNSHRNKKNLYLINGEYEINELYLDNREQLTIQGDVTLTIKDDFVLNNTSIIIENDATLTLHINGDVDINSSYIGNENHSVNSWSDPSRIQIFGHDDSDWNITGASTIKGEIYAPECEVEMSGIATLCGRIAANEVALSGASRLLYDQTLDHGGFGDVTSSLYDDTGALLDGIQQLTRLDPILIDALYQIETSSENNQFLNWQDWWSTPTERPNEVVYALLVYGIDAHRWESLARNARRARDSTYASVMDQ